MVLIRFCKSAILASSLPMRVFMSSTDSRTARKSSAIWSSFWPTLRPAQTRLRLLLHGIVELVFHHGQSCVRAIHAVKVCCTSACIAANFSSCARCSVRT